jgi:hypothetical protein
MVSLWEDRFICILDQEFKDIMKLREKEDIKVMVKERVQETQECHKRFYGWEDREFLDVY